VTHKLNKHPSGKWLVLVGPYDEELKEALKAIVPPSEREWRPAAGCWRIGLEYEDAVRELIEPSRAEFVSFSEYRAALERARDVILVMEDPTGDVDLGVLDEIDKCLQVPGLLDRFLSLLGGICNYAGVGGTSSSRDAEELAGILGVRLLVSPDRKELCIDPSTLPGGYTDAYAPHNTIGWTARG
jgi:hypothetical protein